MKPSVYLIKLFLNRFLSRKHLNDFLISDHLINKRSLLSSDHRLIFEIIVGMGSYKLCNKER